MIALYQKLFLSPRIWCESIETFTVVYISSYWTWIPLFWSVHNMFCNWGQSSKLIFSYCREWYFIFSDDWIFFFNGEKNKSRFLLALTMFFLNIQVTVLLPANQNVPGANLAVLGSVTETQQPIPVENDSQVNKPSLQQVQYLSDHITDIWRACSKCSSIRCKECSRISS